MQIKTEKYEGKK